ncbi:MAG: hypothetical protein M3Q49_00155 [Actinomycetota bacterium]|nr:hypothetical protein [Actinomycetota bacterium]MDP9484210.1 hypothetical protein [Actinomycetota bacterium]
MFVRKKRGRSEDYYQLVESRRVDGKPRQRVLLHLGRHPTIEAALKAWPKEAKRLRCDADRKREIVPTGAEVEAFYRDLLKGADALDGRAEDLERKLERLREFKTRGVVPTITPLR